MLYSILIIIAHFLDPKYEDRISPQCHKTHFTVRKQPYRSTPINILVIFLKFLKTSIELTELITICKTYPPVLSYKQTVSQVHPGHHRDHSIFRPPPLSFQQSSNYNFYTKIKDIFLSLPRLCLVLLGSRSQSPTEFHQSSRRHNRDSLSWRQSTVWMLRTARLQSHFPRLNEWRPTQPGRKIIIYRDEM